MNALEYVEAGRLSIKPGALLRVQDGRGSVVHVWQGMVWITQKDDHRDYYVRGGETFVIDRQGGTVVSAIGDDAVVSLAPADVAARVVLAGVGSKGPIQLAPTARPGVVARLLALLGLSAAGASA